MSLDGLSIVIFFLHLMLYHFICYVFDGFNSYIIVPRKQLYGEFVLKKKRVKLTFLVWFTYVSHPIVVNQLLVTHLFLVLNTLLIYHCLLVLVQAKVQIKLYCHRLMSSDFWLVVHLIEKKIIKREKKKRNSNYRVTVRLKLRWYSIW